MPHLKHKYFTTEYVSIKTSLLSENRLPEKMHTAFFAVILCYLCSGITSSRLSRRRHVTTNQVEEPARRAKEDQSAIVRVFSSRRKHRWLSLRPSISVKRQRIHMITETPTNSIRCKIFCRSGYHLEILPSGVVKGTIDQESKYG